MLCTYCGSTAAATRLNKVYGGHFTDDPRIWYCGSCDAYVRRTPIGIDGIFADRSLRQLRMLLHDEFDKLWRGGSMTRTEAYRWLSLELGIERKFAHFRYLNEQQCNLVMEALCKR